MLACLQIMSLKLSARRQDRFWMFWAGVIVYGTGPKIDVFSPARNGNICCELCVHTTRKKHGTPQSWKTQLQN